MYYGEGLLSEQLLYELERQIQGVAGHSEISFMKIFQLLIQGNVKKCISYVWDIYKNDYVIKVDSVKHILITILVIGLICLFMQLFTESFQSKQIAKMVTYLFVCIAALLLLTTYERGYEICSEYMKMQGNFMQVLIPVVCIVLTVENGVMTGTTYYELTMAVLYVMQLLLQIIFMPLIKLYITFTLLNHLGEQRRFVQLQKMCKSIIMIGSRWSVYLGSGSFLIHGMLFTKIDVNKRNLYLKGIEMIPGIGDVSEQTAKVIIGSAELTRNCLGVTGILLLGFIVIKPMIQLIVLGAGLKGLGSILEMVGEKKISSVTSEIGGAQFMFVRLLACEAGILILALSIISLCVNHM